MLFSNQAPQKTYYDVLGVKEDATHEEIRTSYRSSILDCHPDKLQKKTIETSNSNHEQENRYFEVRRAWEILGDLKTRAVYDTDLKSLREDEVTEENIDLEDMDFEDSCEILSLFYPCRCGDYFSIDSSEFEEMGYPLLRSGSKISLQDPNSLPGSVVLPCGSCSLKVRLFLNPEAKLQL